MNKELCKKCCNCSVIDNSLICPASIVFNKYVLEYLKFVIELKEAPDNCKYKLEHLLIGDKNV